MASPPPRRSHRRPVRTVLGTNLGALLLLVVPVAVQRAPIDPAPDPGLSLTVQAITSATFTVIVGGLPTSLAPEYTERTTDRIVQEPGETFLFGIGIFVVATIGIVLLAITVVGLLLAIPIVIAMAVVGVLGYLAVGRVLVDDWGTALLVAAVASAFTDGVPLLGGLVGFVIGCTAFGAWYLEYKRDESASPGSSKSVDRP